MSVESHGFEDWESLAFKKVGVLRGLADARSETEIAATEGVEYNTIRGHVEQLKDILGIRDVKEMGRWWRRHARDWHRWCAAQAGLEEEETVRTVG